MTKTIKALPKPDPRLAPLYSVREAASYLGLRPSTLRDWVHGYRHSVKGGIAVSGKPIIQKVSARLGDPTIPFVGLVEAPTAAPA